MLTYPNTEAVMVPHEWLAYDLTYQKDYPGPNGDFTSPSGIGLLKGAGDPEDDAAARLAWRMEIPYIYGRNIDGSRVTPNESSTYHAVYDPRVEVMGKVATEECAMDGFTPAKELNHHGDRAPEGLDMSFENAFEASHFGQLVRWVEDETGQKVYYPEGDEIIAILDHRAAPLLHDEHPYIRGDRAREVFVHEVVRGTRHEIEPTPKSTDCVNKRIDSVAKLIETDAPTVDIHGARVVDLRQLIQPRPGYSEDDLVIKAAASIVGKVAWFYAPDAANGHRVKEKFSGLFRADHAPAFAERVKETGMTHEVIDPNRDIAMAYLPLIAA